MAIVASGIGQQLQQAGGAAFHLLGTLQQQFPARSGIEHVVTKACAQGAELFAELVEALLRRALQADTTQLHLQQLLIDDAALTVIQ